MATKQAPVSPEIAAAMGAGRSEINRTVAAGTRGLENHMGRYNFQAPELYAQLAERLGAAGNESARLMDQDLQLVQLRKSLHDKRLAMMWDALERQRKADRMNTYATALGAAGAIGGNAIQMGNQWRSTVPKKPVATPPPVASFDSNPFRNPYLGLLDMERLG